MANRLVVDVGETIIGIQGAYRSKYIPYYGKKIKRGLERLENASEIITYNGKHYDFEELNKFSTKFRSKPFAPRAIHTDMREIIWGNDIWGSCLLDTFNRYCVMGKEFDDSYEDDNRRDVYMTLQLWKHWKAGGQFQ